MTGTEFDVKLKEIIGTAMQRHGVLIGDVYRVSGYGDFFEPCAEAYRTLRVKLRRDADGIVSGDLSKAKCPTCSSRMKVVGVEENTGYRFADTDCDDAPFTYAVGTLVCIMDESHGVPSKDSTPRDRAQFREQRTVALNGTLWSLVRKVSDIADEWGL